MNLTIIKGILLTALAALVFTALLELPLKAEAVFLKDGSIVDGTILSEGAGTISVRLSDNKIKQLPRSSVTRILYTKLKMGKVYIQKRDGKGIVAFMVDEDQERYTFRMELFKPEEFLLKRSDVLFISEKNPSGLQVDGNVETDSVSLLWLPPYDSVKKYNIYMKKNEKDKYELVDSTKSKSITLEKLSSNTVYFIVVTSVDSADYESSPSNELKITTANISPEKPSGIIRSITKSKAAIKWNESKDPDGKVTGYNVYNRVEKKKIATVKTPEYTLPDNLSVYKLEISAVDDLEAESSKVRVLMPLQLVVSAAPAVFSFSGKLGDMFKIGYGATVNIGLRNFLYQNAETGINFSYLALSGKEKEQTERMNFIPVTAYAGYHVSVGDWFSFFPFVKLGESYSKVKYTGLTGDHDKSIVDPIADIGIAITGSTDRYTFSMGANCGILYESAGIKSFYEVFVGGGIILEL